MDIALFFIAVPVGLMLGVLFAHLVLRPLVNRLLLGPPTDLPPELIAQIERLEHELRRTANPVIRRLTR